MTIKQTLVACIALASSSTICSQTVTISPTPQSVKWGAKAFDCPESVIINGATTADQDAVATLLSRFKESKDGVKVSIGKRGDKAVKSVSTLIPKHPEGYYLKVDKDGVTIAGADDAGTYYGVQTFLALASQPEVMSVEIIDWPATPNRGVVEGFYGNAWSHANRLSQFDFYGANKLNTYIYGPKDDPYHREKWREPYPFDEAQRMKELTAAASKHKVNFVWGIHPAGDHSWKDDDNRAIVNKFEQLYSLGVRTFAIFFDDVFGQQADGKKHAKTIEYVCKNFVKRHSDVKGLIVCPSLYNKAWSPSFQATYLEDLSTIDPAVKIMWTGNAVVDFIDVADVEWVNSRIGRKAFIWLNYPVTDFCVNHLLMGPTYGNEPEATSMVSGFTANPMEYAEASKVSLFGVADFLWNPQSYDADTSWGQAVKALMSGHEEAFRTFCLYNVDLGQNAHGLRRLGESPALKMLIDKYEDAMSVAYSQEGADAFRKEFTKLAYSATELLGAESNRALVDEITPWLEVARLQGERGQAAVDMYEALADKADHRFIETYKKYASLTDSASRITSRDFPGSIKVAYPMVGTLYAEPFLRRSVAKMEQIYREMSNYGVENFPSLPVENGSYHIKLDGAFLGNPDADGEYPVLQQAEDNVNPDRQVWRLTYVPETKGYSIVNAKDSRYLTEKITFGKTPFDKEIHTFMLTPVCDGFLISNTANSRTTTWTLDKTGRLVPLRGKVKGAVFKFVPIK
ncbi:MAG: beta-N-acetylglucosaminidase domain-containing protein [Muribaculaceae bacterium]|nr:beta-N-acetylglucosaminidase domain-containing protein [Muribaculaceae bacterium]